MTTEATQGISIFPNPVIETIYTRRAVRKYSEKPVDRILIEKILDAGRMAPSALNRQPWKFYVLTDREQILSISKQIAGISLKQIAKINLKDIVRSIWHYLHEPHFFKFFNQPDFIFHGAPVVIFITAPKDNEWAALDIGMCSQNMMLAAKSLGLDSCPVGLAKFIEETDSAQLLRLSKTETVHLAIILGYGEETPHMKERTKNNVFYIN